MRTYLKNRVKRGVVQVLEHLPSKDQHLVPQKTWTGSDGRARVSHRWAWHCWAEGWTVTTYRNMPAKCVI
jgi:hypothetical protein